MRELSNINFLGERIEKPWGYEILWAYNHAYAGKILYVKTDHALSLQHHNKKLESMLLISGEINFIFGESIDLLTEKQMFPGESLTIEPGKIHRVVALSDATIVEISTPELTDIVRHQDLYSRI